MRCSQFFRKKVITGLALVVSQILHADICIRDIYGNTAQLIQGGDGKWQMWVCAVSHGTVYVENGGILEDWEAQEGMRYLLNNGGRIEDCRPA